MPAAVRPAEWAWGLAITERAVRLHGGTVKASNRPEGGLQVEIRLPLAADASPEPDRPVEQSGAGGSQFQPVKLRNKLP